MRDIGKNIKQLRQLKNMTQDELAEKLFVTRQTVSNYETGKSRPDIEMLTRIAETLETDPNTVLYGLQQPVGRKKKIITFCALMGVIILYIVLAAYVKANHNKLLWTNNYWYFRICFDFLIKPFAYFIGGFTVMQGLGLIAKLTPFSVRVGKWLRFGVVFISLIYLLISIPYVLHLSISIPGWWETVIWLSGAMPNSLMDFRPVITCFLGCALWLGIPQKVKE